MTSFSSFVTLLAVLSFGINTVTAGPPFQHSIRQAPGETCTQGATFPNLWSVQDLSVVYSRNDSFATSIATFSVTNRQTNLTDTLSCSLRANYQCYFTDGLPSDKSVSVYLQLNLMAYISFSKSVQCDGNTALIQGMAEMVMDCTGDSMETGMSCAGGKSPVFATGKVDIVPE